MVRSSARKKTQRVAAVHEFMAPFVRRVLGWRVGPRGILTARSSAAGVITVVHRFRDGCNGDIVDHRIAQLRPEKESGYKLFWKKGNGRWAAYYDDRGDAVEGSLADCVGEISRDPFGCYWNS